VTVARLARHTGLVRRGTLLIVALCAVVAGGASWLALGAAGQADTPSAPAGPAKQRAAATATPAATEQPPIPTPRPKVVQPVAGQTVGDEPVVAVDEDDSHDKAPTGPASASTRHGDAPTAVKDAVHDATALPNGIALPPLEAPTEVLKIIEAGNVIARSPYKWGGGHGKWLDNGYDCSGSVSFALAAAGLLDAPMASGPLMKWGKPGRGKWVTIYTHSGHVFMEVAGLRFDTSGAKATGSRWQNVMRGHEGFVARHPPGL
jgi:cell wall-associated NlpC family hydrolase